MIDLSTAYAAPVGAWTSSPYPPPHPAPPGRCVFRRRSRQGRVLAAELGVRSCVASKLCQRQCDPARTVARASRPQYRIARTGKDGARTDATCADRLRKRHPAIAAVFAGTATEEVGEFTGVAGSRCGCRERGAGRSKGFGLVGAKQAFRGEHLGRPLSRPRRLADLHHHEAVPGQEGASSDEVEAMHAAWTKAVLPQAMLWTRPYAEGRRLLMAGPRPAPELGDHTSVQCGRDGVFGQRLNPATSVLGQLVCAHPGSHDGSFAGADRHDLVFHEMLPRMDAAENHVGLKCVRGASSLAG